MLRHYIPPKATYFCSAIDRFPDVSAVVVGDIILDVFLWGIVNRISPEAPVPVVEIQRETRALGGAANVANNIRALGASVYLIGRIGGDPEGQTVKNLLAERGIQSEGLVASNRCSTTVKTRIIAHNQQVVRFDREVRSHLTDREMKSIASFLEDLPAIDVVIVSDYAKGVVTPDLMEWLRSWTARRNIPLVVDPKVVNASFFRDVTVLTPNHVEASQIAGMTFVPEDDEHLCDVASRIMEKLRCQYLLITRGPGGMSLFSRENSPIHLPTIARQVYDVTGAGDTVIATLSVAICAGLPVIHGAYLANLAAGHVVGEVGTAVITAHRLKELVQRSCNR